MFQLKACELQKHDVTMLTPGNVWAVTTDVEIVGPLATFRARMHNDEADSWHESVGLALPADFQVDIMHAWRTISVPCLICKERYPHRMDIAVVSEARGVCGPCDERTTRRVLTDRERST